MKKTVIICDHCGKQPSKKDYWTGHLELTMTGDYVQIGKYMSTGPQHFCSPKCLIDEMVEATSAKAVA